MLFTEWTYQIYAKYQKDPSNLCCFWKGPIKLMLCLRNGPIALMLFTEGTHQAYFVYPMNPSNLIAYSMDTSNLRYLQYGSIKRMLFTELTHQLILFTQRTHQT